jgi:hypothetical protein
LEMTDPSVGEESGGVSGSDSEDAPKSSLMAETE